jgi:hypothetical protein
MASRTAPEIGLFDLTAISFICFPPGSVVTYRVVVYVIALMIAGLAIRRRGGRCPR